jgi:hypothetical protein
LIVIPDAAIAAIIVIPDAAIAAMIRDPFRNAKESGKENRLPETRNHPRFPKNSAAVRQLGSGPPNSRAFARGFLRQVAPKPLGFYRSLQHL